MFGNLRDWFSRNADSILSSLIANALMFGGIALIGVSSVALILLGLFARDFFRVELRVWHLFVLFIALGLVWLVMIKLRGSMRTITTDDVEVEDFSLRSYRHQTMEYGGVNWAVADGEYVEGPFCPEDGSFLARLTEEEPEVVGRSVRAWSTLEEEEMKFVCMQCGKHCNLRGNGSMPRLRDIVLGVSDHETIFKMLRM